jgi:serine protease Do
MKLTEEVLMKTFKSLLLLCTLLMAAQASAAVSGLPDFTGLVEQAAPAVVNIRVTQFGERSQARNDRSPSQGPLPDEEMPEFFRRFFGDPNDPDNPNFGQRDRYGAGSGFIIDAAGYVVTNHHVIEDADQIIVRLGDRREFEATLVGSDEMSDIALLKIEGVNLPTLNFGAAQDLRAGEWVVAIGSPFNFDQSVTAGIVSAKGRSNGAQQYVPFIQTDVAINQGNSGGPLLNMEGEVVGVNSWILSSNGGYIGLSFSIPEDVVQGTLKQLRETGSVQRGLLGVMVGGVTRELAEAMQLDRPVGALVNDVSEGGAAERGGIEPGDIILAFNGQAVETSSDLPPLVGANPTGTKATVTVSRDGKQRDFDVVLDALNPEASELADAGDDRVSRSNVLGLAVENISAERRREMNGPDNGVLLARVESDEAWRAGLRPGDVILMINNKAVADVDSFDTVVDRIEPGKAVALRVWREGATSFIAFTPREIKDAG